MNDLIARLKVWSDSCHRCTKCERFESACDCVDAHPLGEDGRGANWKPTSESDIFDEAIAALEVHHKLNSLGGRLCCPRHFANRSNVLQLSTADKSIVLQQFPVIIGRSSNGSVVSIDDFSVGHYQCMIDRDDSGFAVWDLGTKAGTIINGERIKGRASLLPGDELVVGDKRFTVSTEM